VDKSTEPVTHREWQEHLVEVTAEQEPGWEARYAPGSFGCHELLDRVHLLGDLVEGQVLEHPSCALHPEWYHLAARAAEALRELYQRIGAEHLASEEADATPDPARSWVSGSP
jgi:hypothetical protein